jgi:heme A synthase
VKGLRNIVSLTAAVAIVLAVLGTWVRIENAGRPLCSDWPLCRGAIVPSLEGGLTIEWAHRALASVEGFLIVMIFVTAWPRRRAIAGLMPALGLLGATFALEVGFGAVAARGAASPLSVAAHWGLAMLMLGTLVGLSIVLRVALPVARGEETWLKLGLAAALAFAAMCIGSYVSASESGLACTGFPGCNETFAGHTAAQFAQMLHRLVAGSFVVVAVLATIAARQHSSLAAKRAATAGVAFAFCQACLGIATVRLGDPLWVREAHAAVAGLTFLVFTAAAVFAALEPKAARRAALRAEAVRA